MSKTNETSGAGRRIHERFEMALPVTLIVGSDEYSAVTRNVGMGGLFIATSTETNAAIPFGARLRVRFQLPSLKEVTDTEIVVRWKTPDGIGVQFVSLRAIEVWGLNRLFLK